MGKRRCSKNSALGSTHYHPNPFMTFLYWNLVVVGPLSFGAKVGLGQKTKSTMNRTQQNVFPYGNFDELMTLVVLTITLWCMPIWNILP